MRRLFPQLLIIAGDDRLRGIAELAGQESLTGVSQRGFDDWEVLWNEIRQKEPWLTNELQPYTPREILTSLMAAYNIEPQTIIGRLYKEWRAKSENAGKGERDYLREEWGVK